MPTTPDIWMWLGVFACVTQSALFSGLNLAVFSLPQLRLQIEVDGGNKDAKHLLSLRKNSNQVLATIIWGNVGTNVLLTMLSNLVLAGVFAFLFSTVVITLLGEIIPQAYFSRNALRMAARLLPFLNFYRIILFPLAKPTAMLLDWWLGMERVSVFRERDMHSLLGRSAEAGSDIGLLEATGATNFFDLDDIPVTQEGEPVHAQSIIALPSQNGAFVLPKVERSSEDPFLRAVNASGEKWVIVTDLNGEPAFVLDSDHFLRDALFDRLEGDAARYWHRPIIVCDMQTRLGEVIGHMKLKPERPGDDVIDDDLILVWGEQRRIITGSDLLGRLLRDIATVTPTSLAHELTDKGLKRGAKAPSLK